VQLGGQAGQRPVPGEVGLDQPHRPHDRRMCHAGIFVPLTTVLGDGLAELTEQER
jgi:hypothetical protein